MRVFRFRRRFALPRLRRRFAMPAVAGLSLAAGLTASTAITAQSPQPSQTQAPKAAQPTLPAARAIVDRHLTAIGGRAAVLGHTSTRAVGTLTIPSAGLTGNIEMFAAKPDRSMLKISITGVGEVVEAFDGKIGWNMSPMTGPMLLEGKQLEEKRFDADFYAELHENGRYQSMTTLEQTDFDGRPCYKIRLLRKNGGEDIEFYDVQTGLKAGRITTRETPMGTITGTTIETDYKKFADLLQPTMVKQTVMGVQQVITITAVEYDNVSSSVFEPPAAIKALIK